MATITSDPILIGDKSYVTTMEGDTATVVRIATGKGISQEEKDTAGDYYNRTLNQIDYAKIYIPLMKTITSRKRKKKRRPVSR